jgi:hypothetical protein
VFGFGITQVLVLEWLVLVWFTIPSILDSHFYGAEAFFGHVSAAAITQVMHCLFL